LRPRQFCNLSEVVIRENDTLETLKDKVRLATILGTFQSTLTDFKYLSKEWTRKCEEERLLGVSLTGIMDNKMTSSSKNLPEILTELKKIAVETNKELAEKIGINPAAAITCVKPSGTVSSLVNSASGIHARHSDYYIRTVRQGIMEPLTSFMQLAEMPNEPDVTKPESQVVFSFPVKSPKNSVKRNDMNAIDQLEVWLTYQRYWCEHKPSVTISVKENEWLQVGSWVYEHFNEISGISFLPHSDHVYKQAPFQECSKEEYDEMVKKLPKNINWDELSIYESEDTTTGSKELACSAGACEIL
jgi:ribonucleoside-diphosphate reductase alpha chain